MSEPAVSLESQNTDSPKVQAEVVHPQAWLQRMYSAGRGGFSGGRGRGSYRKYDDDDDDDDEEDDEDDEDMEDGEIPAYKQFLNKYDDNYKNPIFHMLYKKPLETEEDIKRYREERRKNYPTKSNVEKREKDIEERLQKGEVIVSANERVRPMLKMMGIIKEDGNRTQHNQNDSIGRGRGSFVDRGRGRGTHSDRGGRGRGGFQSKSDAHQPDLPGVDGGIKKRVHQDRRSHNDRNQQCEQSTPNAEPLLPKLLKGEIYKEKSILLQCFRYIINQKFFCNDDELSDEMKTKLDQIDQMNKKELEQYKQYKARQLQQQEGSQSTIDIERDEENEQDKEVMNVTKEDEDVIEAIMNEIGNAAHLDQQEGESDE
ncbi:hypothetical protein AKO1_008704, partial [Acrasis kona]